MIPATQLASDSWAFPPGDARNLAARLGDILAFIQTVARSSLPVLMIAPRGRGTEILARLIHSHSRRSEQPFRAVACGLYSRSSLERRLFGRNINRRSYVRRASGREAGDIAEAHAGTLFLDQLQCTSAPVQDRLLRLLREREYVDIETGETHHADVRLIVASREPLEAAAAAGRCSPSLAQAFEMLHVEIPSMLATEAGLRTALTLAAEEGLVPADLDIGGPFPAISAWQTGGASAAPAAEEAHCMTI